MRLLVLGGTVFLGHTLASMARDRGDEVTCLARGRGGDPPEGVEFIRADRRADAAYDGVAGRTWDAVVEVSWEPTLVRSALAALAERSGHWTYVSSCSVYASHDTPGAAEDAPLTDPLPAGAVEGDPEQYAEAKVSCEQESVEATGEDRVHLSRAGLLAGPGDRSDRVGYWPARFARGGAVLVPASAAACQLLDVRDYAAWLLEAAERGVSGPLNAVGESIPWPEVIATCAQVAGWRDDLVAADPAWLLEQGVRPWAGDDSLPLWLGEDPAYAGFGARSDKAAVAAGMRRRPIAQTLEDTLADERDRGLDRPRRAGLKPGREAELLAAWSTR